MVQLVKHLTLDFGSGHSLTVCEFEPRIGLHNGSVEPSWDILCVSLSPLLSAAPQLEVNK